MAALKEEPIEWPFEPFEQSSLDGSVSDRFESIARRYPSRLAIADRNGSLTYAELARLVDQIASAIEGAAADRTGTVAILLNHESRFPAAILGAMTACRGCVPLNADDPATRNQTIAADALAAAVISADELADQARRLFPELPVIAIETLQGRSSQPRRRRPLAADLAYIIYTSGSTGKPKGVYQNHRGLLDDLRRATDSLHLSCEDRQGLFYPPSLASGFRIALSSLLTGGSLHVVPPRELGPAGVAHAIREQGITIFRGVPTLFRRVVEALRPDERLDSLRIVSLGGDRVDWRDWDAFRRGCSADCLMGVHLGATECSLYLNWFVDERLRDSSLQLPVGRVLPGRSVVLMDDAGRPVAEGEVGEFCVTGRHLALGYWRDPERTARAFATDPADPESRTYRTGDLGRRRPDGLYEYAGRKDQQIKLHGHRVEPGEIEIALRACTGVRDAAVVVRRTGAGVPSALVAYAELDSGADGLLPPDLLRRLAERIPRRMMPTTAIILKEFPRLPNLKIDRVLLTELDAQRSVADAQSVVSAPRTRLEAQLCALYARVTGAQHVGAQQSFFEIGGDSVAALLLVQEARRKLGYAVTPAEIFEHQTPAALAAHLTAAHPGPTKHEPRPTAFLVPGAGGDSHRLHRLRQRCAHSLRIIPLEYPHWSVLVARDFSMQHLVAHLIEQLDERPVAGPIVLVGYSAGGFVAHALAEGLLARGREVGLLVILDTDATPPTCEPRAEHHDPTARVGPLRRFYWDVDRIARSKSGSRDRQTELAVAIAQLLTHPSWVPVLRRLRHVRRLSLPGLFRHLLHGCIGAQLHAQYANAWRDAQRPKTIDVSAAVFVTSDRASESRRAADLGWGAYCRAPQLVAVDGDHWTMLDEPHVGTLAARLADLVVAAA